MPKILNPPTTHMPKPLPSSSPSTTTAPSIPPKQKQPSRTPATPFLASRSEIRAALADDHDGQKQKRVLPSSSSMPGNPDVARTGTRADKSTGDGKIHFESGCFRPRPRLVDDAEPFFRAVTASGRNERCGVDAGEAELGDRASGKGDTVVVVVHDDDYDDDDAPRAGKDDEDEDDDLPPGLDSDLPTALRRFAWAYVRGLGGLVMGVLDGFTRAVPEGYGTYGGGGSCRERGRVV